MLLFVLVMVLFVASVAYRVTEWEPYLHLIWTVLAIICILCEVLI